MSIGLYGKEIQALVVTVLLYIATALEDSALSTTEIWTAIGIAVATAGAMSFIKNAASGVWSYAKAFLAAVGAGVAVLIPALDGGLSTNEIVLIIVAVVGLGSTTAAISNAKKSDPEITTA